MNQDAKPIHIEPVDFRAAEARKPPKLGGFRKGLSLLLGLLVIVIVAASAWYVFTARKITIRVDPVPDRLHLTGGWPRMRMGESVLLKPGAYTLVASKSGFHELNASFDIETEHATFEFVMGKLPGRISINAHHVDNSQNRIAGASVIVDSQSVGSTPLQELELPAGEYGIMVNAERYMPFQTNLFVEGMGCRQELQIGMIPAWAEVTLDAEPGQATVSVNGEEKGEVPVRMELLQGTHDILLQAKDHKPYTTQLVVRAHTPIRLDAIKLVLVDAHLLLESKPSEVVVTLDGEFKGNTPLQLDVRPHVAHSILFSKAGYAKAVREVNLRPGETRSLALELEAISAIVNIDVEPEGTELLLDGESMGATPGEIELTTAPHKIEIRKEGYRPYSTTITPKVGFAQDLNVRLEPVRPKPTVSSTPGVVTTSNGYELKKIQPGTMTMGSSRREQGRRSNETLRQVKLTRPFYMGLREVTNKEYHAFKQSHNSGVIKMASLNRDEQPAVNVPWEDAALFCNWLSEKEGLPNAYERSGENVVAKNPIPNGYRLPTEAEWAYCARTTGSGDVLKYPWGKRYPPKDKTGNYADMTSGTTLANHLQEYTDGFEVSAPPSSFSPNHHGLFDIGGNVAEWCHDLYTIYLREPGTVFENPIGPSEGRYHVIRGSSWKQSSIGALRLSQRGYGNEGRNDVGFRVCRYAD